MTVRSNKNEVLYRYNILSIVVNIVKQLSTAVTKTFTVET
jgi:hypothetical protein